MTFENDKPDYGLTKPSFRGFGQVSIAPKQQTFSDASILELYFILESEERRWFSEESDLCVH